MRDDGVQNANRRHDTADDGVELSDIGAMFHDDCRAGHFQRGADEGLELIARKKRYEEGCECHEDSLLCCLGNIFRSVEVWGRRNVIWVVPQPDLVFAALN